MLTFHSLPPATPGYGPDIHSSKSSALFKTSPRSPAYPASINLYIACAGILTGLMDEKNYDKQLWLNSIGPYMSPLFMTTAQALDFANKFFALQFSRRRIDSTQRSTSHITPPQTKQK